MQHFSRLQWFGLDGPSDNGLRARARAAERRGGNELKLIFRQLHLARQRLLLLCTSRVLVAYLAFGTFDGDHSALKRVYLASFCLLRNFGAALKRKGDSNNTFEQGKFYFRPDEGEIATEGL